MTKPPLPGLHWRLDLLVTSDLAAHVPATKHKKVKTKKKCSKPARFVKVGATEKRTSLPRQTPRTTSESCPSLVPPDATVQNLSPLIRDMQTEARERAHDRASLKRLERAHTFEPFDMDSLEIFDTYRHDLCEKDSLSYSFSPVTPRSKSPSAMSDSYIFVESAEEEDDTPPELHINYPVRPPLLPTLSYGNEDSDDSGRSLSSPDGTQQIVGQEEVTQSWLEAQIQEAMSEEDVVVVVERMAKRLLVAVESCALHGDDEEEAGEEGKEEEDENGERSTSEHRERLLWTSIVKSRLTGEQQAGSISSGNGEAEEEEAYVVVENEASEKDLASEKERLAADMARCTGEEEKL